MLCRGANDWFDALRASAHSSPYQSHLDRLGPGLRFPGDADFDWLSVLISTGSTILGLIVKGDAAMRQIIFRRRTRHDHI
jgi:hypothetical protein